MQTKRARGSLNVRVLLHLLDFANQKAPLHGYFPVFGSCVARARRVFMQGGQEGGDRISHIETDRDARQKINKSDLL